jgi:hypothetical protein
LAINALYYATPRRALMSNAIANALNSGNYRQVREFLTKHVALARENGARTMIVSAENFYSMAALAALGNRTAICNFAQYERRVVEALRSHIPGDISSVEVVCYFRRPDHFIESLYNQQIKRDQFGGTFDEFYRFVEPALCYATNMAVWSQVFGEKACFPRLYDSRCADIVSDFAHHVLGITEPACVDSERPHINERIGRDLLEFKRELNRRAVRSDRDTEYRLLCALEERLGFRASEPPWYQDFLSPEARAQLLARVAPEVEQLRATYGLPAFATFDPQKTADTWQPYPGLTSEKRREIEGHYRLIDGTLSFRFERLVTRTGSLIRGRLPVVRVALRALKAAGAKQALLALVRGRARERMW